MLVSLALAVFWGAAHALSPGHGKTIVSAYLVGSRGTPWHAALLGLITTATHTAGVFALGGITLLLSQWIVPDTLYPWLDLSAGLMVVVVGSAVLFGRTRHARAHRHGHDHHHHTTSTATASGAACSPSASPAGCCPARRRSSCCWPRSRCTASPSGCCSSFAFSLGLAVAITLVGLVAVMAKSTFARFDGRGRLLNVLPAVSAFVIVIAGVGYGRARSPESGCLMFGLDQWVVHFSDGTTLLIVLVVAVLLGLRHASDPDHLTAVTTLVTNGRGGATRLGLTWGLGHASSLLALGIPIVLWKAYLPARVEESAEVTIGLVIMALALWLLLRWRRGAFAHGHTHLRVPPRRTPLQAYGIGLAARDRRQRRRRRPAARGDPQPDGGADRPGAVRVLHRRLDGAALDRLRLRARPAAHPAGVRPGRARVRGVRGLLRDVVHARSARTSCRTSCDSVRPGQ